MRIVPYPNAKITRADFLPDKTEYYKEIPVFRQREAEPTDSIKTAVKTKNFNDHT